MVFWSHSRLPSKFHILCFIPLSSTIYWLPAIPRTAVIFWGETDLTFQSVEEPGLYSGADWISNIYERKNSKAKRGQQISPFPCGQFFQVHGNKLKLHPVRHLGQASVRFLRNPWNECKALCSDNLCKSWDRFCIPCSRPGLWWHSLWYGSRQWIPLWETGILLAQLPPKSRQRLGPPFLL